VCAIASGEEPFEYRVSQTALTSSASAVAARGEGRARSIRLGCSEGKGLTGLMRHATGGFRAQARAYGDLDHVLCDPRRQGLPHLGELLVGQSADETFKRGIVACVSKLDCALNDVDRFAHLVTVQESRDA
jgi:hypothetical protein